MSTEHGQRPKITDNEQLSHVVTPHPHDSADIHHERVDAHR